MTFVQVGLFSIGYKTIALEADCTFLLVIYYVTIFMGCGGALVELVTFDRRVVGSNPALAAT